MRTTRKSAWLTVVLLMSTLTFAACGDDDPKDDEPDAGEEAGRGGRGGRAGRGGSGGAGGADDDAGAAGTGGKAGSGSSEGPNGCYEGEPKESIQYLNRCTDSECEPFDNDERLPLLVDGKLPSLP